MTQRLTTSEPLNAIIITKKQRYRIDLPADWPANYIIESSSKTPLQIQVTVKLEPSDFVGSWPVSPVLISSVDNIDNSDITQPESMVPLKNKNNNSLNDPSIDATSASKNQTYYTTNMFQITRKNKLVSPFISVPNDIPLVIFLEEYTFTKNDFDADDDIDETRKQLRLKKEKNKPATVHCFYDIAGNTYLQKDTVRNDLCHYISKGTPKVEKTEISDLFDYYYEEELSKKNTYQDQYISAALFTYRTTCHHTTSYEPFYLLYGRPAILPVEVNLITSQTRSGNKEELQKQILRQVEKLLGEFVEA
ncbi:13868_t:CDS:2 [Dentiscutata erythropus]|uniref:13868_t:CDS:1 n=1 Tax=Dentiscutata erythropus TaxID=1348616 RepID=A0A9N8ZI54_9GLOM|nr:13868_t:CDS:2 [Dentiscutata erythropus]